MPQIDILKDLINDLIDHEQWDEVAVMLIGQHPADLAELITRAPEEHQKHLFKCIEEDQKPDVLAELESDVSARLLETLSNTEVSDLVEEMAPDDAADILADLSAERTEQVLDLMEDEDSDDVRELLRYEEDTAGGLMTTDVVSLPETLTVSEGISQIGKMDIDEPFYFIYTVDSDRHLTGVLGLWEFFRIKDKQSALSQHAHHEVVSATTHMDQEDVARLMSKYDLTAIPVVDDAGRLVGRVTIDDVVDVLEEEASEDIFKMAGSHEDELQAASPLRSCRTRLPWLLITLVTGFLTSLILRQFMERLEVVLVLTYFVPIVMAMSGNAGIQSTTLVVRSLAIGTMQREKLWRFLAREFLTGMIMGLICGILIGAWARYVIQGASDPAHAYPSYFLAATVAIALFCSMAFAALYGALVPMILNRFKIDPAVASGPFVTSSNDITSLLIYYSVTIAMVAMLYPGAGAL